MSVPYGEPATITAGDSVTWLRAAPEYPAGAGWVMSYVLINSAAKVTITTSAAGDDHLVDVAASTSAVWAAGRYQWQAYATLSAARHTVASGTITVAPNFSAATTLDNRTPAGKALDAMDAALADYGARAHLVEIQFGDRRQKFADAAQFAAARSKLQAEVAREENLARLRQGLAGRNVLHVRMGVGR